LIIQPFNQKKKMNKKIAIIFTALILSLTIHAKDYKASLFGIKSDGVTLNTASIQYAIDHISANGGGQLNFYVGRYLTGSFQLKPNVTIQLHEGAILVAFQSAYDYLSLNGTPALILADSVENIGITGKGVIEGHGQGVLKSISTQVEKGFLKESDLQTRPALIHFNGCNNVKLEGIILRDACGDAQVYTDCKDITVNNITVESKALPGSKGMVISGCDGVTLGDSYFDTSGSELVSDKPSKRVTVRQSINAAGKKLQFRK